MRAASAGLLIALASASVLACKHDYKELQTGTGIRAGQGGGGSGGQSGDGSGGESGSGSGGAGTGGSTPGACEPCEPLSDSAEEVGLESCCRGPDREECGIALGNGTTCLPREAPGEMDSQCPAVGPAGQRRDGCCRPDGHCGASFDGLGLGCVAREDIPTVLAPMAMPIACQLECTQDRDCSSPDAEALCVPVRDQPDMRVCAPTCKRDQDCASGLVCGLGPDRDFDRLVAFCQEPFGDVEPGGFCSAAEQCAQGVCLRINMEPEAECSLFCRAPGDCPAAFSRCVPSMIPRPSGDGTPHTFSVCSR